MNERIKELYEQAHEQKPFMVLDPVTFDPIHKIDDYDKPMYHKVFNPEKFAELIVKECCSKLVEMGESWHKFAKNPPQGQAHNASGALFAAYRLKEDAVDEIKEHFGVEE